MMERENLDSLCAALAYALGIQPPREAAEKNTALADYVDRVFQGRKADRVVMYNPDAIAQWIWEKYPLWFKEAAPRAELELPLTSVMPSVTPVCFGTMYTGAQPEVHGIRSYTKPVITIDTLFDAMLRAGKKCAIVCRDGDSLSRIYNERSMDYFYYPTMNEVNAKAAELIIKDEYNLIVVYNGNYDSSMHRWGTEHPLALGALRSNSYIFAMFEALIRSHWQNHTTLLGFAMDHGCHDIDGGCGSHGLDMDEDLDILHFYGIL